MLGGMFVTREAGRLAMALLDVLLVDPLLCSHVMLMGEVGDRAIVQVLLQIQAAC